MFRDSINEQNCNDLYSKPKEINSQGMFCFFVSFFQQILVPSFKFQIIYPSANVVFHTYYWRALVRQQPIFFYNSEKKPKFFGCKIGDLHASPTCYKTRNTPVESQLFLCHAWLANDQER